MESIKYYIEKIHNCLGSNPCTVLRSDEDIYEIEIYYKKDSSKFVRKYSIKLVFRLDEDGGTSFYRYYINNNEVEFTDLLFDIVDIKQFIIEKPVFNATTSTTTSFSNKSNYNTTEWIKTSPTTST